MDGPSAHNYTIYRNTNYEDVRGGEIKLARAAGRFVNGWFTYERIQSRSGRIGEGYVHPNESNMLQLAPRVDVATPKGFVRALLRVGTPLDWGPLTGGWSASVVQEYRSGGEVVFNPDAVPRREIDAEYFIPTVDYYNTDLRLTKDTPLWGGRRVSVFVDVTNLLNTRRLTGSAIEDEERYFRYLVGVRRSDDSIKYGEESTFYVLTRPYRDEGGGWRAPISPRNEWLHHMNPRRYRLGVRFDL